MLGLYWDPPFCYGNLRIVIVENRNDDSSLAIATALVMTVAGTIRSPES